MKKIVFVLGFLMATSICVKGHNYYNQYVSISLQTFYDELAPYGEWIYTPEYGYAWLPYISYYEDFRPYATRGNWVYTDLGWTWISEYRWGWATFHYGRWYFDDYFGWMWLPGYEWAPAWVTWGYYNDYWAWAPMGPNMYANMNFAWHAPAFWWTFVPFRYFCTNNWHAYIYNRPVPVTNITYITNVYYGDNHNLNTGNWYHGPRVGDVERHSNTRVQKRTLVDTDKPANLTIRDNQVTVYRPGVTQTREKPQPANFRTVDQHKINSRTIENSRNNIRPEPVNQRTVPARNENIQPRSQPTTPTQDSRERYNPGVQNRPSEMPNPTRVDPTRKETEKPVNSRNSTPPPSTTQPAKNNTPPKTNVRPPAKESTPTQTTPTQTKRK